MGPSAERELVSFELDVELELERAEHPAEAFDARPRPGPASAAWGGALESRAERVLLCIWLGSKHTGSTERSRDRVRMPQ